MAIGAYCEIRRETGTAAGTETAVSSAFATKIVFAPAVQFGHDNGIAQLERDDEMRNVNEPLLRVPEMFAPSWSMELRMYPDSLAQLLAGHLGAPATTTGDGVITDLGALVIPASAYRHRWTAPYATGAAPQTLAFRLGYGDGVWMEIRGATIESLAITTPDAGGCRVQISGRANFVGKIADPSLTPTYETLAIEPFHKSFASLAWLSGTANTETVSVTIAKPVEHSRTFGSGSKWPNLVEHGDGVPMVTGSIVKRTHDTDDFDALLGGTRFTVLIGWVHTDVITGTRPYTVYVQGPSTSAMLTSGGPEDLQNRRRTPASYDFALTRDSAASSVIECVNATASYS